MKNYKDYKRYFTQEEWEKFEANMSLKISYTSVPNQWGNKEGLENYKRNTIIEYLYNAFPWNETPEGCQYWFDLKDTLKLRYESTT